MAWTLQRKETFNTRLSQWGFTRDGRPLAQSARRTLEAMLKYVGLIFILNRGERSVIIVSKAGRKLLEECPTSRSIKKSRVILGEIIKNNVKWNVLETIKEQMKKLIITNPVILEDCVNILVFPFCETLRLLLDPEIEYLTKDEIGYILFSMKSPSEYELIKRRIINFRSLLPNDRKKELNAFRQTPVGNKILVQAPTAGYYINYCLITGLCEYKAKEQKLRLNNSKIDEIKIYVEEYSKIEPFDFESNIDLWIKYFGDPRRRYPPIKGSLKFENPDEEGMVISYFPKNDDSEINHIVLDVNTPVFNVPLFPLEKYIFEVRDIGTGGLIEKKEIGLPSKNIALSFRRKTSKEQKLSLKSLSNAISELLESSSGLDKTYEKRIKIYSQITKQNDYLKNARATLRGGRFEYLFYRMFRLLESNGIIDNVIWNGSIGDFGIMRPASPGKGGLSDIQLRIDDIDYFIELTTIGNSRAQWTAEGVSVHDHIGNCRKFLSADSSRKVIGIFSAPTIHVPLKPSLENESKRLKTAIVCIEISKLIELFTSGSKKVIKDYFLREEKRLLGI